MLLLKCWTLLCIILMLLYNIYMFRSKSRSRIRGTARSTLMLRLLLSSYASHTAVDASMVTLRMVRPSFSHRARLKDKPQRHRRA